MRGLAVCLVWGMLLTYGTVEIRAAPPGVTPANGLRNNTPEVHALVGARIVLAPGKVVEKGTIVIRDGLIVAVGADVKPPADARVWDVSGKTLYAGFFDAYTEQSAAAKPGAAGTGAATYWNPKVVPQTRADESHAVDKDLNKKLRAQGIAVRLVAPTGGIVKGTSALVTTGDDSPAQTLLKEQAALHLRLTPIRGDDRDTYPTSSMGAFTLVRQALYDADWYRQAWQTYQKQPGLSRPEQSEALEVLQTYPHSKLPVVIDTRNELYFLRADQLGREFDLNVIVRGSGLEYRRLDAIVATGRAVIVPLTFPGIPNVKTPETAINISLEELLDWDLAPENPALLAAAGVRIAFTAQGLKDSVKFLDAVRTAVRRGLSRDDALKALTTTPAALFGMADRLGTLEAGKSAHLVVVDGDVFDKKGKVVATWIDGRRYETVPATLVDLRGQWEVSLLNAASQPETVIIKLSGEPSKLNGKLVKGDAEAKLTTATLADAQFGGSFKGEALGWPGIVRLSATVTQADPAAEGKSPDTWLGTIVWSDGKQSPCTAKRVSKAADDADAKPDSNGDANKDNGADDKPADDKPTEPKVEAPSEPLFAVNYPLGAQGRAAALPLQPGSVLLKGATVWTCGPQGVLKDASVLVVGGKIEAVGRNLAAPADALVIDCTGKHLAPGILDCHTHIATDGGVNEAGQTISAEVRIGDFVNPNDVNIYRQLAGGVTTVNILHGSANTIGGQNQVIKLRWGALPEELKLAIAPPGIKFALGENVKQANWGEKYVVRYPQTRMGVEQLVLDAFRAARHYQRTWAAWRESPSGLPPRVDLELEALSEVLDGKRWVHCHSYRQDEILAFLRTCAAFDVKVATLQHVLEGYKVADVMAQQGVGGSTFSDWWAYKFEVYDAIPYNAALMHNSGVVVSLNSDNPELARRLNLEAAKAVKYGGVPEVEALKFVTLYPAKQLRIDAQVGSLEPGKDADLGVWSGSPLSSYSHCEQTWIDGRKYFGRDDDLKQRQEADRMRAALVQRALTAGDAATQKEADAKKEASAD